MKAPPGFKEPVREIGEEVREGPPGALLLVFGMVSGFFTDLMGASMAHADRNVKQLFAPDPKREVLGGGAEADTCEAADASPYASCVFAHQ